MKEILMMAALAATTVGCSNGSSTRTSTTRAAPTPVSVAEACEKVKSFTIGNSMRIAIIKDLAREAVGYGQRTGDVRISEATTAYVNIVRWDRRVAADLEEDRAALARHMPILVEACGPDAVKGL